MVGQIHLATVFYTDGSADKTRPILLLKQNRFGDFVYVPLTTNLNTSGIRIGNAELSEGYLPKPSIVVYEKISVISTSLLHKKIATVAPDTYTQIIGEVVNFLQHG